MSLKRYDGIDILKTICAFLVVCIHATFEGRFGGEVAVIARVAVPTFFMITGFFYDTIIERKKEKDQLKKIFFLFAVSNILYFVIEGSKAFFQGEFSKYIHETFTLRNFVHFILLNKSMSYGHLWYFGAILYVLLIFMALKRFVPKWETVAYIIAPLLLISNFVLGKYRLLSDGVYESDILVRSFLFTGIPCFTIGMFLKKHEKHTAFIKNNNILAIFLIVFFTLSVFFERRLLSRLNAVSYREMYASSVLLAAVLVVFFSKECWSNFKPKFIAKIGKKYSMLIYIIHPVFIYFVGLGAITLKLDRIYYTFAPVIVFVVSTLFAICYYFIKEKLSLVINNRLSKTNTKEG